MMRAWSSHGLCRLNRSCSSSLSPCCRDSAPRRAWIAKLLIQELVDPVCGAHNYAAFGLERDFVLLQAVMRDLLGAKANSEAIRLHALSVIGECMLCCLAGENLNHALIQLAGAFARPGAFGPISRAAFAGGSQAGRGGAGVTNGEGIAT